MPESTKPPSGSHQRPRQIIGLSLDPDLAREVKAHAGKHGLSLKQLFAEMWQLYKKERSGGRS